MVVVACLGPWYDIGPDFGVGREYSVVHDEVGAWWGDCCGQAFQEGRGVKQEVRGAVVIWSLELVGDAAVRCSGLCAIPRLAA